MKVDEKTLIKDILNIGPMAVDILRKSGMGCIACPSSQNESIGEAAKVHGIDAEKLIEELNKISFAGKIKWRVKQKLINAVKARYNIK